MVEDRKGEKSEKSFKWPGNHPEEKETETRVI